MLPARRALLLHSLWTIGGALLALGLLDLLLADFVDLELLRRETRLHPGRAGCMVLDPWMLRVWHHMALEAGPWGQGLLACFSLGASATAHVWLRGRRSTGADAHDVAAAGLALAAAAGLLLQWLAAGLTVRSAVLADHFLALAEGGWMRWESSHAPHAPPWPVVAANTLAGPLTAALLPAAAAAWAAIAVRRGRSAAWVWSRTVALALPVTVAVAAAALLRVHYHLDETVDAPLETWPAALQLARWLVLGGAALAFAAGAVWLRGAATSRRRAAWAGALALVGLGLAAFAATASQRAAVERLFDAPDRGVGVRGVPWVSAPATIDPPRVDACPPRFRADLLAVASLDPERGPLLEVEGMHWWLEAPNPDYPHSRWLREQSVHWDRSVTLLVDRRVLFAHVEPFVAAALEVGARQVIVEGAAISTFSRRDGLVTTWNLCPFGELDLEALADAELADDATWADLLGAPGLVRAYEPPEPGYR